MTRSTLVIFSVALGIQLHAVIGNQPENKIFPVVMALYFLLYVILGLRSRENPSES